MSAGSRAARAAVITLFAACGLVAGAWSARIPALKAQVGLGDAAWGGVVLASGIGALLAMLYVRSLVSTVDSRWLALGAFPLILALPVLLATVRQPVVLAGGLFLYGAATGAAQTPLSTMAAAVERARDRPLMSSFHGMFSFGALAGGLSSAWAARAGMAPAVQFGLINGLLAVLIILMARRLPQATASTVATPEHRSGPLLVLGAIAFGSLLVEGACNQWSAIYLRESLGSTAGLAALGFSAFACCMAIGRLAGDRLVHAMGHARVIRWGVFTAAVVAGLGLLSRTETGALVAFGALGLGMAGVVPAALSLAGRLPGHHPGRAVASVSVAAWPATLFGPPLVGALAALTNLAVTLTTLVPLAGLAVVLLTRWLPAPTRSPLTPIR